MREQTSKQVRTSQIAGRILKYFTLEDVVLRPGALDVLRNPSRISNTYFWPNGDITKADEE